MIKNSRTELRWGIGVVYLGRKPETNPKSTTCLMNDPTPVCIVGAGPAGTSAALKLAYHGIRCVLIDKATFPRDKVCGDAISGKVTTLLNRLDPAIIRRFEAEPGKVDIWGIQFYAPNGIPMEIPFVPAPGSDLPGAPGYVSRRWDFDHFMVREVERRPEVEVILGKAVKGYRPLPEGWEVQLEGGEVIHTRLLLVADGAHSRFSRHVAGLPVEKKHHAGAVRAYYRGVTGMDPRGFIELYFLKELTPGYFWIFPLPNGAANVGLGMRSDYIAKRRVNLRKAFEQVVQAHPVLSKRFAKAEREGPVQGYGLPLGSGRYRLSGDHYMLLGDAAHLVDPLTGEGIGNGFYSGFIAADQAKACIEAGDFSAAFMQAYDRRIDRVLGGELRLSYRMQRLARYPVLVNIIARIIHSNQGVVDAISRMYTDFEYRKQLINPLFWIRQMFKKSGSSAQ